MNVKRVRGKNVVTIDCATNTSFIDFDSFASTFEDEHVDELASLPNSASSTPEAKKSKMEADLSLHELQENLMRAINQNTEKIMERINRNATSIDQINEQMNSLLKDMGDTKNNVEEMRGKLSVYENRIKDLEEKVDDQERYHRQWNLRLFGLPEKEGENLMKSVAEICYEVAPDVRSTAPLTIDICHRLGPKREGRIRPIIIRFTSRFTKKRIWGMAKDSAFLQERKLHFKLDLTAKDKEIRNSKWPQVEAARKENKKAFFIGVKAFIDGKII